MSFETGCTFVRFSVYILPCAWQNGMPTAQLFQFLAIGKTKKWKGFKKFYIHTLRVKPHAQSGTCIYWLDVLFENCAIISSVSCLSTLIQRRESNPLKNNSGVYFIGLVIFDSGRVIWILKVICYRRIK